QQQASGGTGCSQSTSLAAATSYAVALAFAPASAGNLAGSLQLGTNSLNAASPAVNIALSGTAVGPGASFSPPNLTFANQNLGSTSAAETITLSNLGNASLTITSIGVTGINVSDFEQTNTCTTSPPAGSNCTIAVTFAPTASGTRSAAISVADNATGSPQTVSLTGTGVATSATFSVSSLSFANQR